MLLPFALLLLSMPQADATDPRGQVPNPAPFTGLDTLAINDWWNRDPSPIVDLRVPRDQTVAFALYCVQDGVCKISAQLFPLYPKETRTVRLEVQRKVNNDKEEEWKEIARGEINDLGWSHTFRIESWDHTQDTAYRIRHGDAAMFTGLIRKDPVEKDVIVLGALSCNSNRDRGPRAGYVANLRHQDPDLLFFAGDQSYDHKEHTAAWLAFGLQFRDVLRDRPCITIPDDHDVGQSNLWGENGKLSKLPGSSDGGYNHHVEYVRMVERCQTAHLPDPVDPQSIERGIGVYFTRLVVGGVDFAILEDRKFKSGPAGKIPQQGSRPDHIQKPDYDPASIDLPGLVLLGERQLNFLESWGKDRDGIAMKAVLSQTGFCGGAHLHGTKNNRVHGDLDSNGWPQSGRDRALRAIRKAGAVHIAGDQHLATLIQHGIDEYDDGPWAFVVPAIVNNYYGRWWWPEDEQPGAEKDKANPLAWSGRYLDGFGNRIHMHAYANPESASRGAGYGLIRFDKSDASVTFECWPRKAQVDQPGSEQFPGWPRTISLKE